MKIIAAAIGISLLGSSATAQQADPTAPVVQLRKAYDDCVYGSVAAQLQQLPPAAKQNADFSSMAEQGFLAEAIAAALRHP
ncbi:hypothetical protein IVB18_24450 [Bradyrhizobium sp. 186]|uniref:hypothetical protein n=1 Tax=Bradyrhizobium sp. 186 TaxID=2782654 RepID=UPI0020005C56|nr:hypothetical protein [Bradyrhizobium sp. 186]UPK40100.1 hypothetical protein IVB18_24450 [Bradyrhizobium sp. 186]